ncbi:MAG: hypothetical protein WCT18_04375 [Patescibacteria group bacterium]
MKITIKVVEFAGKKVFECEGIKFDLELQPYSFHNEECTIYFYRQGQFFDQGKVSQYKVWADSDQVAFGFVDFQKEELTAGDKQFSEFCVENLLVGDEIVFEMKKEFDFIGELYLHYVCSPWNPLREELQKMFPYQGNWRTDISSAKEVLNKKIAYAKEKVVKGELAILNFNWPIIRPKKKEMKFVIDVVVSNGKKYFSYNGLLFETLPLLGKFWEAEYGGLWGSEINVFDKNQTSQLDTINICEVGTHGATLKFNTFSGQKFLHNRPYSDYLLAEDFEEGMKLHLVVPFELDLTEALAEACSEKCHDELLVAFSLIPIREEISNSIEKNGYDFLQDIELDFSLRFRDKKVELVKSGKIKILS